MTDSAGAPRLSRDFFVRSAAELGEALLGATLLVDGVGGFLVELEIYDESDPASHSFRGPTRRNASMFGPPGHAYVYRSYGIHWCLNFVCSPPGEASALLVRALEPTHGIEQMSARRGSEDLRMLCAGPGRVCQALAVGGEHDGLALDRPPFELLARDFEPEIARCPRIGISQARERPWRLCVADSPYLSRGR
ncbi:MAG: DNA-3-methyladenine glycosylase [Gaiellaceae bacterium]|jgi:DNA-3-methyladenine glycosylase